jgi:hypothetical protein
MIVIVRLLDHLRWFGDHDRRRPAVTVSTIFVSTLQRRPPPCGRPRRPRSADPCRGHHSGARRGAACRLASDVLSGGESAVFDGEVTLEECSELWTPAAFGHPAWRFEAPLRGSAAHETVRVRHHGGEDYRVTVVDEQCGGARVAAFHAALGLPIRPDCGADAAPPIHPGEHPEVQGLSQGTHDFMGCIHPWMHAVIAVSPHE